MKKILITGAAGFVGSHLVEELLASGEPLERLRLFVFNEESLENLPQDKFEIIRGDIRDKKAVKRAMKNVDVVYHLAAMTVKQNRTYADYKSTNVDGTKNLLDECIGKKISKFVFFSSISVYGLPAHVGEIKNLDESHPKKYAEDYGRSKLEAEKLVITANDKYKIPHVIIRPTTVYGPRDHQSLIELFKAIDKRYFIMIGDGENKMDYVFVKDLVKGARQAQLSSKKSEDFILGMGKPVKFKKIVKLVSKSLGRNNHYISVPKELGLVVGGIFSFFSNISGIRFPFSSKRVKVMTTTCFFNINKAKREIEYNPSIGIEKGVNITAKWYLKNK